MYLHCVRDMAYVNHQHIRHDTTALGARHKELSNRLKNKGGLKSKR